jgi:hypothetical protein
VGIVIKLIVTVQSDEAVTVNSLPFCETDAVPEETVYAGFANTQPSAGSAVITLPERDTIPRLLSLDTAVIVYEGVDEE